MNTPKPKPPLTARQREISRIAMELISNGTPRAVALRAATWAVDNAPTVLNKDRLARRSQSTT